MRRFHYQGNGKGLLVVSDDGGKLDVGPLAKLECSFGNCSAPGVRLVRTGPTEWSTRCEAHVAEHGE